MNTIYQRTTQSIEQLWYSGNQVQCLICGKTQRKFSRANFLKGRRNTRCIHCGTLDNERLLYFYLNHVKKIKELKRESAMHLSPTEAVFNLIVQNPNLNYFPASFYPEIYSHKVFKIDASLNSFQDKHFDFFICQQIDFNPSDEFKILKSIYRVLKNNSWAVFVVPSVALENNTNKNRHVDACNWNINNRLIKVGFETEIISHQEFLSDENAKLYGFNSSNQIIYCRKI